MITDHNYTKIKSFINDQIDQVKHSIVIVKTANGYKVNDLDVLSKNDFWLIMDKSNTEIACLRNKRLAILLAANVFKRRFSKVEIIPQYDLRLSILKHDKKLFEYKIKNKIRSAIFEDRYSKTIAELEQLNTQISNLEKSVGLQ